MKPDTLAESGKLRIDKWLWAARFFKTRALAADADGLGRLEARAVHGNPASFHRIGGKAARLVEARRPQPFVDAQLVGFLVHAWDFSSCS